jgi:hypothetical protein
VRIDRLPISAEDRAEADGRVLVVGGGSAAGVLASAELYDPRTGIFSQTGPLSTPRLGHTATMLADGRVIVVGGGSAAGVPASAEVFE